MTAKCIFCSISSWNGTVFNESYSIQAALTHIKHFKGLLCALNFHLCGSTDIHVVVLVLTHDLGLKGPGERGERGEREREEEGDGMKEGTVLL